MIANISNFRSAVLAALGHAPDDIQPGRLQRFSTSGRRGDTAGWCLMFADQRGGVFGCYRAGISETWTAEDRRSLTPAEQAQLARQIAQAKAQRDAEQRGRWAEAARRIADTWAECTPLVPGDPVTLYLKRRGFAGVWPLPDCLRLHRALPYWHDGEKLGTFHAMVAPIIDGAGRTVALHRTFITRDGRKAEVPQPKKLTPAAGRLAGACIPLAQPERGCLGIAEGIETALGAMCASGLPLVAAYSAGNLASWNWPRDTRRIVIFADHDDAGQTAASTLRERAQRAGLGVEVLTPADPGTDWCDVWEQRGAVEVSA